jgi:peroxidase
MEFSRSAISPTIPNCEGGKREQMNAITHWPDASNVYGSTEKESREVRDNVDRSLLKTTLKGRFGLERELLPQCSDARSTKIEACQEICEEKSRGCAFAGDFRVNEQPGLSTMHTILAREHNRIAGELGAMNTHWDGEKVFQETRRIVIAQWQHIVYNEWLPILLGTEYMKTFGLLPTSDGYTQDYDPSIDPRINNEFSAAAFRFGHSMIPSHLPSRDSAGRDTSSKSLKSVFNEPGLLQQAGFIENMLRGQSLEDAPAWDPAFNEDIMNHLFEDVDNGGLDLSALNIQRARDHGIPGYNRYREICASGNYQAAEDFDGLSVDGYLSRDDIRKLKNVYDDVEDIDLFVAGILEKTHRDSLVGPTFKCIIGDQFIRFKRGDRFWYENGEDSKTRFSTNQLRAIKMTSMARIICDTTDIDQTQPMAFRTAKGVNSLADCNDKITIPIMNLDMWREGV